MDLAAKLEPLFGGALDRLIEAVDVARARIKPAPKVRAVVDENVLVFTGENGGAVGRISLDARTLPPDLIEFLRGCELSIGVPLAWVLRRALVPIARDNLAYLPAFAAYHIERVSPWRQADVVFATQTSPSSADPGKLDVLLTIIARQRIAAPLAALQGVAAKIVLLAPADAAHAETAAPLIGSDEPALPLSRRRQAALALAGLALVLGGAFTELARENAALGEEIADLDQQIDQRRVNLGKARARAGSIVAGAARSRAVRLLDNLAMALPDDAYLTELSLNGARMQIVGVTRSTADLVPALERTGLFGTVGYSGPTTHDAEGGGDRFQIEMQLAPEDKPCASC
jgi:general secretion pathway protein L